MTGQARKRRCHITGKEVNGKVFPGGFLALEETG
jgi:hypothetical protein